MPDEAPNPEPEPRKRSWIFDAAALASLAALIGVLAALSWRKWPTVLLDFGHELYLPWRLSSGDVLYRDAALLYGPFSQYLNSLWFRLGGVSLTTIIAANLAGLGLLAALIYSFFARAIDRFTGWLAAALAVTLFGFAHYGVSGNFNFICPYSHEATHGVILALALLWMFEKHLTNHQPRWLLGAGLAAGLAALTRVEVATAAGAAAAAGLALSLVHGPAEGRVRRIGIFLAGAAAGPLLFFLFFSLKLGPAEAVRATAGAWLTPFNRNLTGLEFFQRSLGLDHPAANLWLLLEMSAGWLLFAAASWTIARVLAGRERLTRLMPGAAVFVLLGSFPEAVPWKDLPRALPLLAFAAGGWIAFRSFRRGNPAPEAARNEAILLFSVFAFTLTGKMILNCRFENYGFYLALPAMVLVAAMGAGEIPRRLGEARGGPVFRALAVGALAALVLISLRVSFYWYGLKIYPVGEGPDRIMTYDPDRSDVGPMVNQALIEIERRMKPTDRFTALPETSMLNYLTRRAEPTRYHTFMPTEMAAYGEDAILAALQKSPPDYVLLVERSTAEFGVLYFGQDPRYGRKIYGWVEQNYRPVKLIGNPPLRNGRFGILFLERNPAP